MPRATRLWLVIHDPWANRGARAIMQIKRVFLIFAFVAVTIFGLMYGIGLCPEALVPFRVYFL